MATVHPLCGVSSPGFFAIVPGSATLAGLTSITSLPAETADVNYRHSTASVADIDTMTFLGIEIGGTKLQLGVGSATDSQARRDRAGGRSAGGRRGGHPPANRPDRPAVGRAARGAGHRDRLWRSGGYGGRPGRQEPSRGRLGGVSAGRLVPRDVWACRPAWQTTRTWPGWANRDSAPAAAAASSFTRTSAAASAGPWWSAGGSTSALRASPRRSGTSAPAHRPEPRDEIVELAASGWAIAAAARDDAALAADLQRQHACGPEQLTAKMVAEAAAGGNQAARAIFRRATQVYGWAIAQVITLLSPEVIVVGGGVPLAGESLFFAPCAKRSVATSFPRSPRRTGSSPPRSAKKWLFSAPWPWRGARPKTAARRACLSPDDRWAAAHSEKSIRRST